MGLKSIFQMTKTDRYTQDGRDELIKLQETEDVKYKTGDISQKTGLQKQPDGSWAPPKKGARSGAGKPEAAEGWTETRMASGKLYDLKSQGKRIIEQYDPETETKTFKLRDLNNSRAPDKEFKTLEEAKAAAGKKDTAEKKPSIPTDKEVSNNLDELSNSKEMASKVIGGVKVTYNPENGFYKVTHKAPGGQEVSRGCSDILEAQQAVMFRLDRIKKGEIPAISESAESKPAAKKEAAGEKKPTQKRPKKISWSRENLSTMIENGEYVTAKQADNYYHQYGLDKIGEYKDRKGWTVKEYKNDNGETFRAKYSGEKCVGQEYDPSGEIMSPESKPDAADSAPRILTGDTRIRIRK